MATRQVKIRQATVDDLEVLVPLFDAYRQFYRQKSDQEGAKRFLRDRFEHNQSVILLASEGSAVIGFTQLFPSFSSGAMRRVFILNDLFVAPESRRTGAGRALLNAAAHYGRKVGAVRLVLSTELTNTTARAVYEKLGWKCDDVFCVYQLTL